MTLADILVALFIWGAFLFAATALWCAAVDGHRRGRACVHAGRSWQPRPTRATSPDDVVAELQRWSA